MGSLYLAQRVGADGFARPVAIKVIHDHLASNKRFVKMFVDEARMSARIDHPNVVRVEEFGEADGRYYLVMEYVHGLSLSQTLRLLGARPGVPIDQAVAIAMQIAAGLHGAHEATDEQGAPLGIVHRDVSPQNVLISWGGHVRLIDFGVAKARIQGDRNTQTGSLRGKLAYMPPEQARSSKHVDRRADLYALGLVLWEMLAGKRMLDAPDDLTLLSLLKNPPVVPPSSYGREIPPELDEVVLRCLALKPEDRPNDAAEVQRMLGKAYPAALHVIAGDIGGMMAKVRERAKNDRGAVEDPDDIDAEARSGLTVFGRSMHASIEASEKISPRVSLTDQPLVIIEGHDEVTDRFAAATPRGKQSITNPMANAPPLPPLSRPPSSIPRARAQTMVLSKNERPDALGGLMSGVSKNWLAVIAGGLGFIVVITIGMVVQNNMRSSDTGTSETERRVRSGKGTTDEARTVYEMCRISNDRTCMTDITTKYPNVFVR
jgi:serine/threonine protein kinase